MKGNPFDFHYWKRAAFAVALFWSAAGACAQTPGSVDTTFGDPFVQETGHVYAVAMQVDGKVLIGGAFTSVDGVARNYIARLKADGSLDTGFAPGTGANDEVDSVAVQSDGKVLIGGDFGSVNGVARNNIARLNTDGSVDTSFDPGTGANDEVDSVICQSDGKVLMCGFFTAINGVARGLIARLNADGSLDTGFSASIGPGNAVSLAFQSDGKVIVGGNFGIVSGGTSRYGIARLNADGSLDTAFAPSTGTNSFVGSMAVQSDGKVLIGGDFTSVNGVARNYIARLNADGSVDTGFNPGTGANDYVNTVAVQSDGKVLIGGDFTSVNSVARNCIARLNADGSLDTGFDPDTSFDPGGSNSHVNSVAVQSDSKVIIGGYFNSVNGVAQTSVAELNADGSLDASFTSTTGFTGSRVSSLLMQTDGKVLIGGYFANVGGVARNYIARLNADGSVDTDFTPGTGANGDVRSVAAQNDGKVLIGGFFSSINGAARNCIARLNADGSLDTGFDPGTGADSPVFSVAVQGNGKMYVGGDFGSINGVTRIFIARLNSDGSVDTGFDPGTSANDDVYCVTLQSDGKVLIGGDFTSVNGLTRNHIARLNSDGSLDTTFDIGSGAGGPSSPTVSSVALQSDGKVLLGGRFTSFNGVTRNDVARLNSDGSLDTGFDPGTGTNDGVASVAAQIDERVLIGGQFTSVDGVARNYIARLNADGSLDTGFDPGTGADNDVNSVAAQSDGKVLTAGSFTSVNGVAQHGVARLIGGNAAPTPTPTPTPSSSPTPTPAPTATPTPSPSPTPAPTPVPTPTPTPTPTPIPTPTSTPTPAPTPTPLPAATTISLTGPLDGASVVTGGNVPVTAVVTDPAGVLAKVDLFLGSTLLLESGPSGSYATEVPAPAPGSYVIMAVATDTLGRQSTSTRTIQVVAGDNPGSGVFTTDVAGRLFADSSDLVVSAEFTPPADDPIVKVTFAADGVVFATLDGAGNPLAAAAGAKHALDSSAAALSKVYSTTYHLPGVDKLVTILAQALTASGKTLSASPAVLHAAATSDHPPQATIGNLTSGARLRTGKAFSAPVTVSDPDAPTASAKHKGRPRDYSVPSGVISKVEYYLDAIKVGEATAAPYNLNFSLSAEGEHVLSAIATDGAGIANASAPVTVTAFVAPNVSVAIKGGDDVSEAGGSGKFVLKRDGTDFSQPVTVAYKLKGTAKNGVDYQTAPSTEVIPAGASSVKLKIKPVDEMITGGGTRTVNLKLLASPNDDYDIGSPKKATISILDND